MASFPIYSIPRSSALVIEVITIAWQVALHAIRPLNSDIIYPWDNRLVSRLFINNISKAIISSVSKSFLIYIIPR
jgi:hypothetical protein